MDLPLMEAGEDEVNPNRYMYIFLLVVEGGLCD